jgi:hypothetical protein
LGRNVNELCEMKVWEEAEIFQRRYHHHIIVTVSSFVFVMNDK